MAHSPHSATLRALPGQVLEVEIPAIRLRLLSGAAQGRVFEFTLDLLRLGGSSGNDFVLEDPQVSRFHAELERQGGRLRVRDLDSTNGTFVDGVQVETAWVRPGQTLRLGETELRIEDGLCRRSGLPSEGKGWGPLVGRSPPMQALYSLLRAIAPTQASVWITGESGTGKELIAQAIHEASGRSGPLVPFDAASTDRELIRSDLFGHEVGAFTGAQKPRLGAFRSAEKGTLFLDEIGELDLDLQSRLLRVLESRRVTPLGSDRSYPIDVRVVAATHRDLEAECQAGRFRLDLYHRLAVIPVRAPPLRERGGDLLELFHALAERKGFSLEVSPEAERALKEYSWPGNVRELGNVVERAGALSARGAVLPAHLGIPTGGALVSPRPDLSPEASHGGTRGKWIEIPTEKLEETLARYQGNKAATARALGISLSTLKRRLKASSS